MILITGLLIVTMLTACNGAAPTLKIGLVAPFEGLDRVQGYEALFGVRLALQERNARGLNGYQVELVALNDFNSPTDARRQAQALLADSDVLGVVGHLSSDTTLTAMPLYQQGGLAVITPWAVDTNGLDGWATVAATEMETAQHLERIAQGMGYTDIALLNDGSTPAEGQVVMLDMPSVPAGRTLAALAEQNSEPAIFAMVEAGSPQLVQVAGEAANGLIFASPGPAPPDIEDGAAFAEQYQALAGFPPGPRAILAYEATHTLLDAIEAAMMQTEPPTRTQVRTHLSMVERNGLTGQIRFDEQGRRIDAPVWVYQIEAETYPGVLLAP